MVISIKKTEKSDKKVKKKAKKKLSAVGTTRNPLGSISNYNN